MQYANGRVTLNKADLINWKRNSIKNEDFLNSIEKQKFIN